MNFKEGSKSAMAKNFVELNKRSTKKPATQYKHDNSQDLSEEKKLTSTTRLPKKSVVKSKVYDHLGGVNPRLLASRNPHPKSIKRSVSQKPKLASSKPQLSLQNLEDLRNKRKSRTPDSRHDLPYPSQNNNIPSSLQSNAEESYNVINNA